MHGPNGGWRQEVAHPGAAADRWGAGRALRGRERLESECRDVVYQKVRDRGIHQPVARHREDAAKRLGHDFHAEMAVAAGGAGVAGMQVTFVHDGQLQGRKSCNEQLPKALLAGGFGHVRHFRFVLS
jgi:hypothetical protein